MRNVAKGLAVLAALSSLALAQTPNKETKSQEKFEHVKARILHMIEKKEDFLQKHKACVEKAQNWKELRAFRPHRRWHKKWHHNAHQMNNTQGK